MTVTKKARATSLTGIVLTIAVLIGAWNAGTVLAQVVMHRGIATQTIDPGSGGYTAEQLEDWHTVTDWAREVAARHGEEIVIVDTASNGQRSHAALTEIPGGQEVTLSISGAYGFVSHHQLLTPVMERFPVDVLQLSMPVEVAGHAVRYPQVVEKVVTHEALHALAHRQCGDPAIGDGRFEEITDAATAIVLGLPEGTELTYDPQPQDFAAARVLLDGGCP